MDILRPDPKIPRLHIWCAMDPIFYHQYTPFMLAYIPAPWIRHGVIIDGIIEKMWVIIDALMGKSTINHHFQ